MAAPEDIKIRPHHLLCMFGFRGLGYSPSFVENMAGLVDRFFAEEGATVHLVDGPDDICTACPLLGDAECASGQGGEPVVRKRDDAVLDRLGLSPGEGRQSLPLAELILERVQPTDLEALCEGCQWLPRGYCAEGLRLHGQAP